MFEKLVEAVMKVNNKKVSLNTTSEEVESLVCPSKFKYEVCVEIICYKDQLALNNCLYCISGYLGTAGNQAYLLEGWNRALIENLIKIQSYVLLKFNNLGEISGLQNNGRIYQ